MNRSRLESCVLRVSGLLLLAVGLTACGGGGGSSSSVSKPISGRVIDGYIGGAVVCVDENNNWKCDENEFSTQTDAEGRYTLNYSGSLDGKQILAEVPVGATDSDFPGAPIEKPFSLVSPAESAQGGAEVPVTPFTTMVTKEMAISGASKDAAAAAIKREFNLQENPLTFDYKAKSDQKALGAAQVLTAAIAMATEKVKEASDGQLSAGETALAAAKQVKQTLAPILINSDGSAVAVCSASCSQAELISKISADADANSAVNSISGRIRTIIADTKSGTGKVADFREVVQRGLMSISLETSDFLFGSGDDLIRVNGYWNGFTDEVVAEIFALEGDRFSVAQQKVWLPNTKNFSANDFNTRSNGSIPPRVPNPRDITVPRGWYATWRDVDNEKFFPNASNSWGERIVGDGLDTDVLVDRNCVILNSVGAGNYRACLVEKELSGRKLGEVFPDVCKENGRDIAQCNPQAVLPAGSYGYSLGLEYTKDSYEIWGSAEWDGYPWVGKYDGSLGSPVVPTIDRFLDAHTGTSLSYMASCRIAFRVTKESPTSGKFHWAYNPSATCSNTNVPWNFSEPTSYRLKTVANEQVLEVDVPNLYRKAEPGDMAGGCKFAFGVVNRPVLKAGRSVYSMNVEDFEMPATPRPGVYRGEYCEANVRATYEFTGNLNASGQFMSTTLARFLGEQRGVDVNGLVGSNR